MKSAMTALLGIYLLGTVSPAFAAQILQEVSMTPAMHFAEEQNILEPLSDGLLHPEMPLSRRDLVVSVVRQAYKNDIRQDCFDRISPTLPSRFTHLFEDIPVTHSAALEICVGMFVGIVEGKSDGSFYPQEGTKLVEAAKVITKAYGIAPLQSLRPQTGVAWHEPFWYALAKRGAIPETVLQRDSIITRGEFAEMLMRLQDEKPSQGFHYQRTMIQSLGQAHEQDDNVDPFLFKQNVRLGTGVSNKTLADMSDSLRLQMHTEQRRMARLVLREQSMGNVVSGLLALPEDSAVNLRKQ